MSSRRTNDIKALSERLGSLQITEEVSSKDKGRDTEISSEQAPVATEVSENAQTGMLKNMVLNPGWFNGDQIKFEEWWRGIRLFLKSNRIMETNNRITVILACLRGGVVDIYIQRKLDELDKETGT